MAEIALPSKFVKAEFKAQQPGSLVDLASRTAALLKAAGDKVTVVEATTAGLIQASLQSCPGASSFTTCGAVAYSPKQAVSVLGADLSTKPRPEDGAAYKQSKHAWTQMVAKRKLEEVGCTWSICESGACGPTFNYPDVKTGFTSIYVAGPVEKGIFVEADSNDREGNMWSFCRSALDLLAECITEAQALKEKPPSLQAADATSEPAKAIVYKEDRFGGVEAELSDVALLASPQRVANELSQHLASWQQDGKGGVWMKIPLSCSSLVGTVVAAGFRYHHAKPEYAMLVKWLPSTPCTLPMYAFTKVGVGGVVVNDKDEVLMVKERISPMAAFQDSWKLPGGLADPEEDLAQTVLREVHEETGIDASLVGVVSMRHTHRLMHGQSDMYFLVKLRASNNEIRIDSHELKDAQWMSKERLESLRGERGQPMADKVSPNNLLMIQNALEGNLIKATEIPNSYGGRPTLLYTA